MSIPINILIGFAGFAAASLSYGYILELKDRISIATAKERNRCADAVQDPEFLHCQGFRNSDRVRLAEKIRSGK